MSGNGKMTLRRRRFVDEYVVDGNGARAVRDAGFTSKDAKGYAKQLLQDPMVQAAIQVKELKLSRKTDITAEKVIKRLWEEGNDFKNGTQRGRVSALNALMRHFDGADLGHGPVEIRVVFADD